MISPRDRDEKLAPLLEYFADRLNRVFAYFFCVYEFRRDEDLRADPSENDHSWALRTIQSGCLHASLIALRDLDDFFSPRSPKSKTDDLKASDFGYLTARSFLSNSERTAISKQIAHTTLVGASTYGYRWDIWELTTKCIAQSTEFLKWIESHYGLSHFLLYSASIYCRTKTEKIRDFFAAEIAKDRAKVSE